MDWSSNIIHRSTGFEDWIFTRLGYLSKCYGTLLFQDHRPFFSVFLGIDAFRQAARCSFARWGLGDEQLRHFQNHPFFTWTELHDMKATGRGLVELWSTKSRNMEMALYLNMLKFCSYG